MLREHGKWLCQSVELISDLSQAAHNAGLSVHLDGARLFNAAIDLGVPISDFTTSVDTVSICLSKGLGAPVGSVLAGNKETIDKAFRVKNVRRRNATIRSSCCCGALCFGSSS